MASQVPTTFTGDNKHEQPVPSSTNMGYYTNPSYSSYQYQTAYYNPQQQYSAQYATQQPSRQYIATQPTAQQPYSQNPSHYQYENPQDQQAALAWEKYFKDCAEYYAQVDPNSVTPAAQANLQAQWNYYYQQQQLKTQYYGAQAGTSVNPQRATVPAVATSMAPHGGAPGTTPIVALQRVATPGTTVSAPQSQRTAPPQATTKLIKTATISQPFRPATTPGSNAITTDVEKTKSMPWAWSKGVQPKPKSKAAPLKFNIIGKMFVKEENPSTFENQSQEKPVSSSTSRPSTTATSQISKVEKNTAKEDSNSKWPDSLHHYVARVFAQCRSEKDKSKAQASLKEIISSAIISESLWTKDWNSQSIPAFLYVDDTSAVDNVNNSTNYIERESPLKRYRSNKDRVEVDEDDSFLSLSRKQQKKKKKNKKHEIAEPLEEDNARLQMRLRRFDQPEQSAKPWEKKIGVKKSKQIIGTSQAIEKEYLRLTSEVNPSNVRPQHILCLSLKNVLQKWKSGSCDYFFVCSQMKSIRQDLTVQHIKNAFTVEVYEAHAKVAMQQGDMNEYNQCQTQLKELYSANIPGNVVEFTAYRVLYYVYIQGKKMNSKGDLATNELLAELSPEMKRSVPVAHALRVREATMGDNFVVFFELYRTAPNLGKYLMNLFIDSIRLRALRILCASYRPTLPVDYVRKILLLVDGDEWQKFVSGSGIQLDLEDQSLVKTKESSSTIVNVFSGASSLI